MQILGKKEQKKNLLSSFIFIMILVGYPIFAGITMMFGVESNFLSVVYRLIVLTTASILLLTSWIRQEPSVNVGILIGTSFFLFYFTRMFLEWSFNSQGSKIDWNDFWSFLLLVCLLPALPYLWKKNIPNEYFTPNAIIAFGVIGLVLNFYLIYLASNLSIDEQLFSGRLESERLNPIAYGQLGVSVAIVSLWMMTIGKKINVLTAVGVAIGILGAVASGSRSPFLSLAVCVTFMLMRLKIGFNKITLIFSVIFFMAFIFSMFLVDFDDVYVFNRIESSMFEDDSRVGLISDAYRAFLNNVFFGAGYPFDAYPHNIVLEAFMASGIVGGGLMVATLAVGIIASVRISKDNRFSWISLMFLQYLVLSMVSSSIYYSNIFWMLWVCVVTLGANKYLTEGKKNADVRIE